MDIEAHKKRVQWNKRTAEFVGLELRAEFTIYTCSISIYQGNISLFHVWVHKPTQQAKYDLHIEAEKFIESYLDFIFKFNNIGLTYKFLLLKEPESLPTHRPM